MPPALITAIRLSLGVIWLFEGLWKKLLYPDTLEVHIIDSAAPSFHLSGHTLLLAIGTGETLLAIAIFAGVFHRLISAVQGLLLVGMNTAGILLGGGAISSPGELLMRNLPLMLCVLTYGLCGPGIFIIRHEKLLHKN